jgi:Rps23 Pro-64 3,4-dihydroxylase Tpa1-like proline 4-hydroxylase
MNPYIVVVDDLFDQKQVEDIEAILLSRPWNFSEKASYDKNAPTHWITELSMESPEIATISSEFSKLDSFSEIRDLHLHRVYCNAHVPSDLPLPHPDSRHSGERTILYYGNSEWKPEFAGETVFFENGEIIRSVIPKPGRVVMFDSTIVHCARVPTRLVTCLRLTVAFKFIHPSRAVALRPAPSGSVVGSKA